MIFNILVINQFNDNEYILISFPNIFTIEI